MKLGFDILDGELELGIDAKYDREFIEKMQRAIDVFKQYHTDSEIVDRLFLSFIKNKYGKDILEKELRIVKLRGKYFLEEKRLICYFSADLELGDCNCDSHPKYFLTILKEIPCPRDAGEAKEMMLRERRKTRC